MKAKTISAQPSILLEQLIRKNKLFFTPADASIILTETKPSAIREQLRKMVEKGLLMRIKGGLYHIIPYEQDSTKYFPNWHQVAAALVYPDEYYIGFYSAMDIHGLVTQPSLVEQVVTQKRILPKNQKIKKTRFEFITLNEKHFFGYKKHWIDDFNQIYCSDLEKTFIDCLYKPNYAGGIIEIVKALYKCKTQIDVKRMQEYLKKYDTQVVLKRLGFLLEQLGLFEELRNFIAKKITDAFAPLDPSLPKKGNHNSKWKIIDNIEIDSVLKSIQT